MKLLWIISVGFDVIDQLLIRYPVFLRYWRKSGRLMGQYVSYFIDFEKAYDSGEKYCKIFSLNLVYL